MSPAPPIFPWRLVLASASPRRRQLLQGLDLELQICSVDVDETPPPGMPVREVARHIAERKAEAFDDQLADDQVLITADTTVVIGDLLLNKPADDEDARRMLGLLQGRTHEVITGVCLRTVGGRTAFSDISRVTFTTLDPMEIAYYVERYKPFDKAGSYGVQDWIGYVGVERIEGSFYNVMGLPLHEVHRRLKQLPVPVRPKT